MKSNSVANLISKIAQKFSASRKLCNTVKIQMMENPADVLYFFYIYKAFFMY